LNIERKKIVIISGTRPEIIKLSELVKSFDSDYQIIVVYTSQHFSKDMCDNFLKELGVKIDYNLSCCTSDIGILKKSIQNCLGKLSADHVIVYGDTNSSLAGALVAKNMNCNLIHLEAGLRCFDMTMVEEQNRIKIDSISDFLLAPTDLNKIFLQYEGFSADKIVVTGNLIVDVCKKYSSHLVPEQKNRLPLKYILLTFHRQENVDNPQKLNQLMNIISRVPYTIVFPIHPRTRSNLKSYNIQLPINVISTDPVDYKQFLSLIHNSVLVMTDSGGVQEEAVVLKKPCITLRRNTERQETLLIKANRLFYPFDKDDGQSGSLNCMINEMLSVKIHPNPYGENVTKKTVDSIKKIIELCDKKSEVFVENVEKISSTAIE
jgi:UDP-N-acetylglucosamine 2-epimerase